MSRSLIERRLTELGGRLKELRKELAIVDEQLAHLAGEADDAQLKALVSETPLADHEAPRGAAPCRRDGPTASRGRRDHRSPRSRPRQPARSALRRTAVTVRVVVAEDESIIRLDLRESLEEEGYEIVGETARGDEAVALVERLEPDVAILDIKMPGLDGIEAARRIHERRTTAVLILTAFSQRDLVEQARDAGAQAYLVKPFQRAELMPAVELALARHRETVALERQVNDATSRLEARKVIDRAKGMLMDQHDLTEADAFSFIQQTAMRTRTTMAAVAEQILGGSLVP